MFWKRALSAVVLIPALILIIYSNTLFYSILIICAVALMLIEFSRLSQLLKGKSRPTTLLISAQLPFPIELAFAFALFVAFLDGIFRGQDDDAFLSIANTFTGSVYVGWAFGYHLLLLRQTGDALDCHVGANLIVFLLTIVWCGDIAAYLVGSRFGKHKLKPKTSPNKTIEGAISGLIFGVFAGLVLWFFLLQGTIDIVNAFVIGVVLGVISQLSDLGESTIKRTAKVKDSGNIVPGHGGLLDRCDGLILSTPVLYYYFEYLASAT